MKRFYIISIICLIVLLIIIWIPNGVILLTQLSDIPQNEPSTVLIYPPENDNDMLYVSLSYSTNGSDSSFYIYKKNKGLRIGWTLLKHGDLNNNESLVGFDCGDYGYVYIVLVNTVDRIEDSKTGERFCDSMVYSNPFVIKTNNLLYFFDKNDNNIPVKEEILLSKALSCPE